MKRAPWRTDVSASCTFRYQIKPNLNRVCAGVCFGDLGQTARPPGQAGKSISDRVGSRASPECDIEAALDWV